MINSPNAKKLFTGLKKVLQLMLSIIVLLIIGISYFIFDITYQYSSTADVIKKADTLSSDAPLVQTQAINVADKKDAATGLVAGEGLQMVKANCTPCHSSKLITQNRFTKEGWLEKIRWMQQTQGLWNLGSNEPVILNYLATNYGPEEIISRRLPLKDIEWYNLED